VRPHVQKCDTLSAWQTDTRTFWHRRGVAEGFTLTVFLRASPGIDGAILLDNQPTDTIDQARGIVYLIGKERSILENEVHIYIRMFDVGPPRGPTN
jgi:hypothetical protein